MVADRLAHGAVHSREVRAGESLLAQQSIHFAGMPSAKVFALGIGPAILFRTGDVHGPGSDEGHQFMLVYRQVGDAVVVVLEASVEPVRETGVDAQGGLSEKASGQCRPAFAGFVGNDHCEAGIACACPQSRLAEARVPEQSHLLAIDGGIQA